MSAATRSFFERLLVEPGAHRVSQRDAAAEMRRRLERLSDAKSVLQMVEFVYTQSAIEQRYFEIAPDEAAARSDWYRAQNEATYTLSARAMERLLSGVPASSCDGLVVASSSYAGFPALSRRLQARFGLPPGAICFDVAGLGCGASTHVLSLAHGLLQNGSCRRVCVLSADVMGSFAALRRHTRAPSMPQLVAHCLASDAAAAFLLSAEPSGGDGFSFEGTSLTSRLWTDALDQNDYTADEDNQPFLLVGQAIRHRIGEELDNILDERALRGAVIMHPGGAAVMRKVRERHPALGPYLDLALSVMVAHGNVGSPSAFWVLLRALETGADLAPSFHLVAMAPGIVSTCLRVDGVTTRVTTR